MPLLSTGEVAPDFTAQAHTGEAVRLAELKGKWVVLWFYPVADTPG
jgi:peroxiredoxin Q/BCP